MAFPRRTLEGISELLNSLNTKIQNALLPSGAIVWFKRQTAPTGWVVCDGSNGTPNLIGRYPLGATSNIGSTVEAGLPNITGNTGYSSDTGGAATFSGPFYKGASSWCCGWGGYVHYTNILFDASRVSSIYGKSATVTPPSVKLLPCMKL